jgi:hypothetical protein
MIEFIAVGIIAVIAAVAVITKFFPKSTIAVDAAKVETVAKADFVIVEPIVKAEVAKIEADVKADIAKL